MEKTVYFRELEEPERLSYIDKSEKSYYHDLIIAEKFDNLALVKKEIKRFRYMFFQGIKTQTASIYAIMNEENIKVGYLWYEQRNGNSIYICDFIIFEQYRKQGYGYAALKLLEKKVRDQGISKIMFHVFSFNQNAIKLYRKLGYFVYAYEKGGIRMKKDLLW